MLNSSTLPLRRSLDEFQTYVENEFIPAQVALLKEEIQVDNYAPLA